MTMTIDQGNRLGYDCNQDSCKLLIPGGYQAIFTRGFLIQFRIKICDMLKSAQVKNDVVTAFKMHGLTLRR